MSDIDRLAQLVALAAMGQATRAGVIISDLSPVETTLHPQHLVEEAVVRLKVGGKTGGVRTGYPRWHRDGFIFEVISWIAAREKYGARAIVKNPHTSATSQGLDGLILLLSPDRLSVESSTICEDKCTIQPRETFLQQVMPTFQDRHAHKRSSELVSLAADLLQMSGLSDSDASIASEVVLDLKRRKYQAAFAVDPAADSDNRRKELFSGFEALASIDRSQRIGACFVVDKDIRSWFDEIAGLAIDFLNGLNVSV